jgi:hypothetical protein
MLCKAHSKGIVSGRSFHWGLSDVLYITYDTLIHTHTSNTLHNICFMGYYHTIIIVLLIDITYCCTTEIVLVQYLVRPFVRPICQILTVRSRYVLQLTFIFILYLLTCMGIIHYLFNLFLILLEGFVISLKLFDFLPIL